MKNQEMLKILFDQENQIKYQVAKNKIIISRKYLIVDIFILVCVV